MFGFHGIGLPVSVFPPGEIPWQTNGTWTINSAGMINTPTLGSELIANGGMEGGATPPASWVAVGGAVGTSDVDAYAGSHALLCANGSANARLVNQNGIAVSNGTFYQFGLAIKRATGTGASAAFVRSGSDATTGTKLVDVAHSSTSYAAYIRSIRAIAATVSIGFGSATGTDNFLFDAVSLKAVTLNTLFSVRAGAAMPASVQATGTISGGLAGVVYGLDSISSPTNLIMATHDGGTAIVLHKLVAGTWTIVLSTTATYVSGVLPQIRWLSADTFGLYYNGTQRGSNQTISDAGTGTLHGVISTSSLNTITGFSIG